MAFGIGNDCDEDGIVDDTTPTLMVMGLMILLPVQTVMTPVLMKMV